MVDSGTTQAPARKAPMKVSRYSTELAARMAILSPLPTPMPANERAIWLTRRSKAAHVRLLPSQTTARLSGHAAAWRATRSGIRSEEHTSELQSLRHIVFRLMLDKIRS